MASPALEKCFVMVVKYSTFYSSENRYEVVTIQFRKTCNTILIHLHYLVHSTVQCTASSFALCSVHVSTETVHRSGSFYLEQILKFQCQ
jgi:hypothetical protein